MAESAGGAGRVVVGCKPWHRRVFDERLRGLPGSWHFIGERQGLTPAALARLEPEFVFFLHWSWTVPAEIVAAYECVGFHMTDLPYGRGGSPLQNLIQRGHRATKLSAFRLTAELDAGPVYLKADLCLEGSAEEILLRATELSATMVRRIVTERPEPVPQHGSVEHFVRRRPEQSAVPELPTLGALHDFLRMLDAEGYPRAFLVHQGFRYEFRRAVLSDGRITADVTISRQTGTSP